MDIWPLFGYSRIKFHHHPKPIAIKTKDGGKTDLLELTRSVTPPCKLNPILFNGHLQTWWTAVKSLDIPIYYKRKVFEADDPTYAGSFAVDFAVEPYQDTDDSLPPRTTDFSDHEFENIGRSDAIPMLIVLHGLSGGSHEIYLRQTIRPLIDAGWAVCVVNSRGCSRSKVTSGVLYNARSTWDLRQTVRWLRNTFPRRRLYGLGFSLGANMMVNVRTCAAVFRHTLYKSWVSDRATPCVVLGRGRFGLPTRSRRGMLNPVQPRGWFSRPSKDLAWP